MYLFIPRNRSNPCPYQAFQNISLHCTASGFLNRHTPLLSVFNSHCCPLIKMRQVYWQEIHLTAAIYCHWWVLRIWRWKGSNVYCDSRLKQLRVAFSFAKGTSAPGQKEGPCSIKALLPQTGKTIPNLSTPWASLAVSTLLPCISSQPLHKTRGCMPAERFILEKLLVFWQSQTLHKPVKGLILVSFSISSRGTSHATNTYIATVEHRLQP